MSIKSKIIGSFVIILVLMCIIAGVSIWSLDNVNDVSTEISVKNIPELKSSSHMLYALTRIRSLEFQHITLSDLYEMDDVESRVSVLFSDIYESIIAYEEASGTQLTDLKEKVDRYAITGQELFKTSRKMDTQKSIETIQGESRTIFRELEADLDALTLKAEEDSIKASADGDTTYANISKVLIATAIISVLLGVFLAVTNTLSIIRPLKKLQLSLQTLAESGGDLTQKIDINRKDEIGHLASSVNQFIANLRTIIVEVNGRADSLEESAIRVSKELEKLSKNIEESSATIEELSAGMEETAAAAEEVNASSSDIEQAVLSIAERAQQGASTAKDISTRAADLRSQALKSVELSNKSYKDSKVVLDESLERATAINNITVLSDTILGISDQTNLLALNAAIEAARAGEAGKGFAVVADEIRKLAETSKTTVNQIQSITSEVVSSVGNLSTQVRQFLNYFDTVVTQDYSTFVQTGELYGKDAEFVDGMVGDFSATSEELNASIEGIIKAISEVAITINEGAIGTTNIAERVNEIVILSDNIQKQMAISLDNANQLKESVSKFTV